MTHAFSVVFHLYYRDIFVIPVSHPRFQGGSDRLSGGILGGEEVLCILTKEAARKFAEKQEKIEIFLDRAMV